MEAQGAAEEGLGLGQILKGVPVGIVSVILQLNADNCLLLNGREERSIEAVRLLELADVLVLEDVVLLMEIEEDQTEDFSKVKTGNHLLECLLTGSWRLLVNNQIVLGQREHNVLVVKSTPLAVDGHGGVCGKIHVGELGDATSILHVGGVATRSEDASDLHLGISVGTSYQGTGGIVDQGSQLDGNSLVTGQQCEWMP